jgi:5'-3' exoribonuclease 2
MFPVFASRDIASTVVWWILTAGMGIAHAMNSGNGNVHRQQNGETAGLSLREDRVPAIANAVAPSAMAVASVSIAAAQAEATHVQRLHANKAAADTLRHSVEASLTSRINAGTLISATSVKSNDHAQLAEAVVHTGTKRKAEELELDMDSDAEEIMEEGVAGVAAILGTDDVAVEGEIDVEADADDDHAVVKSNVVTDIPPTELKKTVDDDEEPYDNVRLWEPGWKQRYYRNKFGMEPEDEIFKQQ